MSLLSNIGACQLGFLATIFAVLLSDDLGADELNLLANFVTGIGCIMLIIAAQKQFLQAQQDNTKQNQTIEQLRQRIEKLEQSSTKI